MKNTLRLSCFTLLAACSGPQAKKAYEGYSAAYTATYQKSQANDVSAVRQTTREMGDDGAALATRADALVAKNRAAVDRLMHANTTAAAGFEAKAADQIDAARGELTAVGTELDAIAAELKQLDADVKAVPPVPTTIALGDVGKTSASKLQRIFKAAGWQKDGAAIGTMTSSGYQTDNFDVEKAGKTLNVYVVHPCEDKSGTGAMAPKDIAAGAAKDKKAFLFDPASKTYVEASPKSDATADDAKALLAQVVKS